MTHGLRQRRLLAALMVLSWTLLMATAAFAQIHDVPSVPHMAAEHDYALEFIVRTDSMVYVEWSAEGDYVRALYINEYSEALYWVSSEWFGFPGIWDSLPIPDSPAELRNRTLYAAYWQTLHILNEAKETLR